jgi:hypothetical protein
MNMTTSLEDLRGRVMHMLDDAGFSPELYIIKLHDSAVSVHFDSQGAVEYFQHEVELSEWKDDLIFEYRKEGKRHVAYIQMW